MKIWQRGAILISLPFFLEGVGLFLMHSALSQSQKALQEERKQVYLLEEINQSFTNFIRTSGLLASSVLSDDPTIAVDLKEALAATQEHLKAFKALNTDNAEINKLIEALEKEGVEPLARLTNDQLGAGEEHSKLLALTKLKPAVKIAARANVACLELIELQKHQHDLSVEAQADSLKRLYTIVYGLAALNAVIAVLALIVFRSSIASPLRILVGKAKRLPKLSDFGQPLKGRDEFVDLDRALHGAFDRLLEAKEFRSNLSSMMVHDLRSPLTAISIAAELLGRTKKAELNDYAQGKINNMDGNAKRMLRLINEFLEIEKLQSSELTLNQEKLKSTDLIEEVFDTLAELALYKHIQLSREGPDLALLIDKQKTAQVLGNLVANAIKFSPAQSQVHIAVLSSTGGLARFEVRDQGPGLSPEVRQKLFSKFAKGDTPSSFTGSGLGLFISKWLIESQGGALGCDSEKGAGTTFWFTVPLAMKD